MLIKALYDFYQRAKDNPDIDLEAGFVTEPVNLKIIIDENGNFQSAGFLDDVIDENRKKKKLLRKTPRTIRPTNSGEVAEFLCAGIDAVFGLSPNPDSAKDPKKLRNKHQDYWAQIEQAYQETNHPYLRTLLNFREKNLSNESISFLEWKKPENAKQTEKAAWWFINELGEEEKLKNANSKILFSVTKGIRENILIQDAKILDYWRKAYEKEKSEKGKNAKKGICIVTKDINSPIADSHLPKVKIMGADSYLVSFDKEPFESYGFSGGYNASVSISAVEGYANALTYLLSDEKHHHRFGDDVVICFWAKESEDSTNWLPEFNENISEDEISALLNAPFKGIKNYSKIKDDEIYSVVFGKTKSRIIVYHWLQTTVEKACNNYANWYNDLYLEPFQKREKKEEEKSPLGLSSLAIALMRRKRKRSESDKKLKSKIIVQFYQAAIAGDKLPLSFASKLLTLLRAELASKGVKYTLNNYSRIALLKLILNRYESSKKEWSEEKMIQPQLNTETKDSAYISGRLLAVLAEIQAKAHDYKIKTGITEKFFGSVMKSPAKVFPRLIKLSNHHLSKIKRSGKSERFLRDDRNEILSLFQTGTIDAPAFETKLDISAQGRFTIGFCQQMAFIEGKKVSSKNQQVKEAQGDNSNEQ